MITTTTGNVSRLLRTEGQGMPCNEVGGVGVGGWGKNQNLGNSNNTGVYLRVLSGGWNELAYGKPGNAAGTWRNLHKLSVKSDQRGP